MQSQDIARRLNLPRRYLEQVMQQLVRAGILRGVRGPARRLSAGARAAPGERRATWSGWCVASRECRRRSDLASSSELGRRVIGPFWADTEQELMARLDRVTIEDLCRRAEDQGVASEVQRDVDYAM